MMNGIGEAINGMFKLMAILIIVFIPLGLWKMIDIIIFLCTKVDVAIK